MNFLMKALKYEFANGEKTQTGVGTKIHDVPYEKYNLIHSVHSFISAYVNIGVFLTRRRAVNLIAHLLI